MFQRRVFDSNLAVFVVYPTAVFGLLAVSTAAPILIPIANLIVLVLAINVCIAFAPGVLSALFSDKPFDKSDYLGLGIFNSWAALVLRSGWVLAWRWLGEPHWMTETDFSTFFISLSAYAAVMHIISPGALKEAVPPRRWVIIGFWVGLAVLLGLLMIYSSDIQERIRHASTPNDTAPTLSGLVRPL